MPVITHALNQDIIVDSIIDQSVSQIISILGLSKETDRYITSPTKKLVTPQGSLTNLLKESNLNEQAQSRISVQYTEEYHPESIMARTLRTSEYPDIFRLPGLGIQMRPTYTKTELTLEGIVSLKSGTEMRSLKRSVQMYMSGQLPVFANSIRYEVDIPKSQVSFLYDAWKLQETKHGRGESFADFLIRGSITGGLHSRHTNKPNDSRADLFFLQDQVNVTGIFDSETFLGEFTRDDAGYHMPFTYVVRFTQPIGMTLKFPLFVHQQRIPSIYIEKWQPNIQQHSIDRTEASKIPVPKKLADPRFYQADGGVHYDPYDEWFPPQVPKGTRTELLSPITVEEVDRFLVCGLGELKYLGLDEDVTDYLARFPDLVGEPYALPYGIEIWEADELDFQCSFTCTADGTLRTTKPMNPQRRHYIRVYRLEDLSMLKGAHFTELVSDHEILKKVLTRFIPLFSYSPTDVTPDVGVTIVDGNITIPLIAGGTVRVDDLIALIKVTPQTNVEFKRRVPINQRHVGVSTLIARR